MTLAPIDLAIIGAYATALFSAAVLLSRERDGHRDTSDYFLARWSLPWWAIGASLIAANISAEQIIGASGAGYAIGLGIASYEWMSAITLVIVGKYFLPIFLQHRIYTMPQFLEERFDRRVRTVMAIFWLGVYVFVNLTSVLWLGAIAINTVTGLPLMAGMAILAAMAGGYSLYGGLKVVALTDIVQVIVIVLGGLLIAHVTLDLVGGGQGAVAGFVVLLDGAPEKFDLILAPTHAHYASLPGISVLVGGMWVMNLSYWGFNQYIIQRALAGSIAEAQKGILFAAFLKLLIPLIVVVPGIAASVLAPGLAAPDQAYPEMMKLMPVGARGLVFAALIAAILSSLASMANSISTIFTMDLYRSMRRQDDERQLLRVARCAAFGSLLVACVCAQPLLGKTDQTFQYIQEFTGFFTPGIVVLFLLGMYWKGMRVSGALAAAIGSAVLSLTLKLTSPSLPFLDRVGVVFLGCLMLGYVASRISGDGHCAKAVDLSEVDFSTPKGYMAGAAAVACILVALYATWW